MKEKSTPSEAPVKAKRVSRRNKKVSPDINITVKNVTETLLKSYGIKEGSWILEVSTGAGRTFATKPDSADAFPATLVVVEGFVLRRVGKDDGLTASSNTVDATTL